MLYEIGDKVLDEWVITRTIGEGSYGKVVERSEERRGGKEVRSRWAPYD